jgi:hypothetical protein
VSFAFGDGAAQLTSASDIRTTLLARPTMKAFFMALARVVGLTFDVAPVTLPFFHFRFRRAFPIGGKGASHFHFLFELALLVAADVTAIAFLRLNHGPFASFAFFLGSHFSFSSFFR